MGCAHVFDFPYSPDRFRFFGWLRCDGIISCGILGISVRNTSLFGCDLLGTSRLSNSCLGARLFDLGLFESRLFDGGFIGANLISTNLFSGCTFGTCTCHFRIGLHIGGGGVAMRASAIDVVEQLPRIDLNIIDVCNDVRMCNPAQFRSCYVCAHVSDDLV